MQRSLSASNKLKFVTGLKVKFIKSLPTLKLSEINNSMWANSKRLLRGLTIISVHTAYINVVTLNLDGYVL